MKMQRNIYKRFLYCPNCKNVMELWSKKRHVRPIGHIKTMNCYYCGERVDAVEVGSKHGKP